MLEALVSLGRSRDGRDNGRLGQIVLVRLPGLPWGKKERAGFFRVVQLDDAAVETLLQAKAKRGHPCPYVLPWLPKRLGGLGRNLTVKFDKLDAKLRRDLLDDTVEMGPIPFEQVRSCLHEEAAL